MPRRHEISLLLRETARLKPDFYLPEIDEELIWIWSGHYLEISRRALQILFNNAPWLEVGLGYGTLAILLVRYTKNPVIALEHPGRRYLSNKSFMSFTRKEGVKVVIHNLETLSLPFKTASFSNILFCDVIEHLRPMIITDVVKELKRILKQGGHLIVTTPNLCRGINRIKFLLGRCVNPPLNPMCVDGTWDHVREYSPLEIRNLFESNGFQIKEVFYYHIPYFDNRFRRLGIFLGKIYPPLRGEMGFVFYV